MAKLVEDMSEGPRKKKDKTYFGGDRLSKAAELQVWQRTPWHKYVQQQREFYEARADMQVGPGMTVQHLLDDLDKPVEERRKAAKKHTGDEGKTPEQLRQKFFASKRRKREMSKKIFSESKATRVWVVKNQLQVPDAVTVAPEVDVRFVPDKAFDDDWKGDDDTDQ